MQQAADFATALQLSAKALQFYTPDHPRVVEAVAQLEQACLALLEQQPRVSLTAAKGNLLVDGQPFVTPQGHVKALAAELEKRQIGGMILVAGATRRELMEVVRLLTMRPEQIRTGGGAEEILARAEVVHVRISRVRYEAVTDGEEVVWAKSVRHVDANDAASAVPAILQSMAAGEEVRPEDLRMVLDVVANQDEQLTLLRERLTEMGINREQFDELLNVIAWDKLELDQRVVGAGNVTGAAGACPHPGGRVGQRRDHLGVLAHAEIVVGAPHCHFALAGVAAPDGPRETAGDPLEIGEHPVTFLGVKRFDRFEEDRLVIHDTAQFGPG